MAKAKKATFHTSLHIAWHDLQIFLAVAESGSLSAAAKRLRVTQPTVSRRVAALEAELGEQLFVRTVDGVSITNYAELNGLLRKHIDLPGLNWNKITPTKTTDKALAPFTSSFDLFGDGSLTLIPTPGHTPGSLSLVVRRPNQPALVLVGDLTFGKKLLECGHVPGAGSRAQLQETTAMMNQLRRSLGDMVVLASHDPEAAGDLDRSARASAAA